MDTCGYDQRERAPQNSWRRNRWNGAACSETRKRGLATTRLISRIGWVVRKFAKQLGITHRFSVANSAWTNGTVERIMREILRVAKAILNERRRPLSE